METAPAGALVANQNVGHPQAMDLALARHAAELGTPVAELETFAFQRDLLSQIAGSCAPEEFAALLAEDGQEMAPLLAAYRSGDLDQIARVSQPDDPRVQELLLDARNRRWVNRLDPALRRGGVFAAVGVGHAPGPQGLLRLLSARGYRLQQYRA